MGNKSTICYECGGTVLANDRNTNYEPIIQLVHGIAQTMHRHKDCSKGDVIGPDDRAKAKVMLVGGGGDGSEQEGLDEEVQEFFDEYLEEEEVEEPMTPLEKEMRLYKNHEYEKELERIKELIGGINKIKGNEVPFPQHAPKTKEDDGSIRLSLEEREALAAALYIADVVEITGEKLVNPRRFNAEMKKVLYKVIKDL